jgi:hypothetical protein
MMSTGNPIPPIVPTGPGSEPDQNPDLVDPVLDPNDPDAPDFPDPDSPDVNPDEDPNEQLPRN